MVQPGAGKLPPIEAAKGRPREAKMTKLVLFAAFILAMGTLGFAAANAGAPATPHTIVVGGQTMDIDYN
jgi:hypothetical protein